MATKNKINHRVRAARANIAGMFGRKSRARDNRMEGPGGPARGFIGRAGNALGSAFKR